MKFVFLLISLRTRRMKPKPRSLLMNISPMFPYFANMFLKSSSEISCGRLPTKRRERCVKLFSPGFLKLEMSKVISEWHSPLPSASAASAGSSAGECWGGGAGLCLLAGLCCSATGESVPRLADCEEFVASTRPCDVFRFAMVLRLKERKFH